MPVTPFHFGVGMVGKGFFPRWVSLTSFIISQFAIDLEVAYYMLIRHTWPFHRWAHTFVVGALIGVLVGAAVAFGGRMVRAAAGTRWRASGPSWAGVALSETSWLPAVAGGLLGGLSHPLLDGVMHDGIMPLMPFSQANPFHHLVGLGALRVELVGLAALGAVLLRSVPRRLSRSRTRPQHDPRARVRQP